MAQCLILPDVHLKTEILVKVSGLLDQNPSWVCVSVGDWVDDWGRPLEDYKAFLNEFERFCERYHDRLLLCWGNHDYGYWSYPGHCSGYSRDAEIAVRRTLRNLYNQHAHIFAIIHEIDEVVFSHAGITMGLFREYCSSVHNHPHQNFWDWINNGLTAERLWREDSPLWHRPSNQLRKNTFNPHYLQIVGHTPVPTITYNHDDHMLYTDTWSTDSERKPLGDRSLLLIKTDAKEWKIL